MRHLARNLAERGHTVAVWTVDRGEHLGVRHVDGVEVHYLPTPLPARSTAALLRYTVRFPAAVTAWMRAYRHLRPTVLNVQCFGPNGIYGWVVSRLTRTPLMVSSHGETFADDHDAFGQSGLLRVGLRAALRDATVVSGCSTVVLTDLRNRFGLVGGSVVPNGIDLQETSGSATPPWWPSLGPVILALGRIEHKKGFDLLLRSFASLINAQAIPPTAKLVVAGNGQALEGLKVMAADLGVEPSVILPGRLNREEVAGAVSRATAVVVPSRVEAFGIVALEAWRGGAPLVMTSRGGAADFVDDGVTGLLVDPEDGAKLTDAIARVVNDSGLSQNLVDAASERVRQFSWDRVAGMYEALYSHVADVALSTRRRA